MAVPGTPLQTPVIINDPGHPAMHTDIANAVNYIAQAFDTGGAAMIAASFEANGAAGAGYFQADEQASPPATPTNAIRIFADSSNRFSWIGENGFVRTFDGTAISASRVYTLPDQAGTVVIASTFNTTALTIASDTDFATILGRARIDSRTTDQAAFSHFDQSGANNYAIRQNANGQTIVNSASGQSLLLSIATTTVVTVAAASVTLAQPLTVQSDTDATTILGRTRIDSRTTDEMTLSHFDMTTTQQAAIRQTSSGATIVNSPTGQTVTIRINNSTIVTIANNLVTLAQNLAVTGNVTLSAAGNGILIKEGSNATMGVATLVGGTVTVTTSKVTATSRILLTHQNNGGTVGFVTISARVAATSFTILSSSATDTSDIAWVILEPSP